MTSKCDIVVADYNNPSGVKHIQELGMQHGCRVFVYKKGNDRCEPELDHCEVLPNVGREGHTALHHVVKHFDDLGDHILFTPSELGKYNRHKRLNNLMQNINSLTESPEPLNSSESFECGNYGSWLEDHRDWTIDRHMKVPQIPAEPRGLANWTEAQTGVPFPGLSPNCWNGQYRTTRDLLLQRDRSFYTNILDQTAVGNSPEVGHYIERVPQVVFGGMNDVVLQRSDPHMRVSHTNDSGIP